MKTPLLIAACVLSAAPFATAAEVKTGDSLADVRNALGAPRGQVQMDGRQVLYYDRGEVELQADTVTRVILRTPEEQAELDIREERNRDARLARLNQLVVEGAALRDRKLADDNFKNAPIAYQVAYWENFARSYPGVSVVEPLTIARAHYNEQLSAQRAQEEQAARIADLEERLAQAESGNYFPAYPSGSYYGGYGYGYGYRGPSYPPSFGRIRYDFQTTTAAPYETPHGSPYETPHAAPYATPTTIDFNYYYKPAPARPSGWSPGQGDYRHSSKATGRGREQTANRNRSPERNRY